MIDDMGYPLTKAEVRRQNRFALFCLSLVLLWALVACATKPRVKSYRERVVECIEQRALPYELLEEGYSEAFWVGMNMVADQCHDEIDGEIHDQN